MQVLFIKTSQCHLIPTEYRQIRRTKRHWTNNHDYFPFSIKEALLCFKILPQFYCLFIDKLPVPVAALVLWRSNSSLALFEDLMNMWGISLIYDFLYLWEKHIWLSYTDREFNPLQAYEHNGQYGQYAGKICK